MVYAGSQGAADMANRVTFFAWPARVPGLAPSPFGGPLGETDAGARSCRLEPQNRDARDVTNRLFLVGTV